MENTWLLVAAISFIGNVIMICFCIEIRANARYEKRVSEQQRKILKEWIDTVLDDQDERRKASALLIFQRVVTGLSI